MILRVFIFLLALSICEICFTEITGVGQVYAQTALQKAAAKKKADVVAAKKKADAMILAAAETAKTAAVIAANKIRMKWDYASGSKKLPTVLLVHGYAQSSKSTWINPSESVKNAVFHSHKTPPLKK
jgi:uncharacterized protein (DUF2147 family)